MSLCAGDSRAVLFREGEPVVLNTEHKVDLPHEKVRVHKKDEKHID